jgi:hypothetical protein
VTQYLLELYFWAWCLLDRSPRPFGRSLRRCLRKKFRAMIYAFKLSIEVELFGAVTLVLPG